MNDPREQPERDPLSPADAEALDRLVERGFEPARGEEAGAAREREILDVLRRLDLYPLEASDPSLVDATLARIDAADREQAERLRIDRAPARRVRWADLGAIAAVLLLVTGVAWPSLTRMRATALQAACANNMRAMGAGLSQYAQDHRDFLPMAAGLAGVSPQQPVMNDWNTYEHGGNLVALAKQGYCGLQQVTCPACASGVPHKHFAFRLPAADRAFRLTIIARGALVADANPVIEMRRLGRPVGPTMASWNHAQTGQNVLFGDGALLWMTGPEVDGDNIYLPRGVHRADLMPNLVELPMGNDAFLAH